MSFQIKVENVEKTRHSLICLKKYPLNDFYIPAHTLGSTNFEGFVSDYPFHGGTVDVHLEGILFHYARPDSFHGFVEN